MGEPVRIVDLARDMIRLAGLQTADDIPIVFTGLRPGERLHERLFYDHETASCTSNPKVMLAAGDPPPSDIRSRAQDLIDLADGLHDGELRERLFALVSVRPSPDRADWRPDAIPVAFGIRRHPGASGGMTRVVMFGTGPMAALVHQYLTYDSPFEVVAFAIDADHQQDDRFRGLPVVPFEDVERDYPPDSFAFSVPIMYSTRESPSRREVRPGEGQGIPPGQLGQLQGPYVAGPDHRRELPDRGRQHHPAVRASRG